MKLDARDRQILTLLQEDCRLSNADLADKVGMSSSACWRRVRQFEEACVIARYKAEVTPDQIGLEFQALVHIQLTRHNPEHLQQFITAVQTQSEVLECFATTGQADYLLRVLCENIAEYNRFLEEFLFRLPAVESAQTNVVLKEIKRNRGIPL